MKDELIKFYEKYQRSKLCLTAFSAHEQMVYDTCCQLIAFGLEFKNEKEATE